MAFVVEEIGRSADIGDDANTERQYYASGYATEALATTAVLAYLVSELGDPPNIAGQILARLAPTEAEVVGDWRVRASWKWVEKQQPPPQATAATANPTSEDDGELSFEIGVESVRVPFAIFTSRYSIDTDDPVPDPKKAINFNPKTGVAEGVDIFDPTFGWSETHYFHESKITRQFRKDIKSCAGKTNQGSFRGNEPGEVVFIGASGKKRSQHDYAITFHFKERENRTDLEVVGKTIEKKGWEYVEVVYRKDEDPDTHDLIAKPIGIYVHQVMEEADYAKLGIGS